MISKLFYSPDVNKQSLHRRITPSAEQVEQQQERWNHLAEFLQAILSESTGLSIKTWLQGSYKMETQIRPKKGKDFDIDLGIYFVYNGNMSSFRYTPSELKSIVKQALLKYDPKDKSDIKVSSKERCERVKFTNNFHIDIPVYLINTDTDRRILATEHRWEESDPKAFYLWFMDKFENEEVRFLIRRLIRYIKIWASLYFDEDSQPPSILLTVLVANAFTIDNASGFYDDDKYLVNVLGSIQNNIIHNRKVLNPIDETEDLNRMSDDNWNFFVSKLNDFREAAEKSNTTSSIYNSIAAWQDTFQHFFPSPVEESAETSIVPVEFEPEVQVTAVCKNNESLVFKNTNGIGPIPKGCKIDFLLLNTNKLPIGAVITWTARNEGEEAEYQNDMGHGAGWGSKSVDASAYEGEHYMDVMVRSQYGKVLGFRRVPVKVNNIKCVKRNLPRASYPRNK